MTDCLVCKIRGICCCTIIELYHEDIKFISAEPAFICEKLDTYTGECADYENRPKQCRDYDCGGNPRAMRLQIKGKAENGTIQK